jgi:predicted DNA-binding protein
MDEETLQRLKDLAEAKKRTQGEVVRTLIAQAWKKIP